MCALYVRCALSVLQKECRKVWGARYTLGVRYRLENTVYFHRYFCLPRYKCLLLLFTQIYLLISAGHALHLISVHVYGTTGQKKLPLQH